MKKIAILAVFLVASSLIFAQKIALKAKVDERCELLSTVFRLANAEEYVTHEIATKAQTSIDELLPVRGLSVAAPRVHLVDDFVKFIEQELAPAHFNLLILRVEYNYAYKSYPELQSENPLTDADVKKIVNVCRKHDIRLVPLLDLLGHQSHRARLGNLLRVFPEFDETPHIPMPEEYKYTDPEGLIMKSYCPRHPEVHNVVFQLLDELIDVFEADCFHAGMDEVFYIGHPLCPRCRGVDKAELFAEEVRTIHAHLQQKNCRMMIWGDRLIDGRATGTGMWEGSMNNTHRAIDMIPKDVFICDWHYERADLTPVIFAAKGFDVAVCPWKNADLAGIQLNDMLRFRKQSAPVMGQRFQGIIQTVWYGCEQLLNDYYREDADNQTETAASCLKRVMEEVKNLYEKENEK